VNTLRVGKDLAYALVNCKVWKLAMALKLSVINVLCAKVVNRANIHSETPSRVTHTIDGDYPFASCIFRV
jgi:hypothetical protein